MPSPQQPAAPQSARRWQEYWYLLDFHEHGDTEFARMGSGGPEQVPNAALEEGSLEEFLDRFATDAAVELDDLRGQLRIRIYTEASPAHETEPVLTRLVELGG